MMTPEELNLKQISLQKEIYTKAKSNGSATNKIAAIPDGVADCAQYLNSSPRVMWILKEPYDYFQEDGTPTGGGWLLYEGFLGEDRDWQKNITWQRIIYTMYGLRNGLRYGDMDYIRNKPEMGDVMKETVILNLSKMPAQTTSGDYTFAQSYEACWKPILIKQIELYNPQVIIFGNTFDTCWPVFVPEDAKPIARIPEEGRCFINLYKYNGRLLLDAYHPGIRSNVEFYVNSIIDTIREFFPKED